uniref:HEPN domain-containing protein n=1 Tax=Serratia proteamaculans (strain 568) TaxID=399741 RepID=A8GDF2_SERP5
MKESKKLLREKGEDTFLALTKWQKEIYFFYSARLGFLQGATSGEKLDEVIREKINASTHGTVDVLVKLYFPDFKSDVEYIFKKLDECNNVFGLSESQKLTKAKALENMIPLVIDAEGAMQSLIDKFCESLSSKII